MIENARKTGKVPGPLKNRPELDQDLEWVLDAWNELSKGRSKGSTWTSSINYKDILAYKEYKKLDYLSDDEFDRLTELIYGIDAEYMAWLKLQEARKPKVRPDGKQPNTATRR